MRFFKYILTFSLALLLLTFAVSCDSPDASNGDGGDVSSSEPEADQTTEAAVAPKYTVIYPKGCPNYIRSEAQDLRSELRSLDGNLTVAFQNDESAETEYEILVGNTNRAESQSGKSEAGNAGWWVQTVGKKIVINGLTYEALSEAVNYFTKNFTVKDGIIELSAEKNKIQNINNTIIEKKLTLRVGSYNIKNGSGVNHKMSVLAEDIKRHNLDIVGLQEVDIGSDRSGGIDTLKLLAEAAGYEYYSFTHTINIKGGKYGTAIMSHYPIVKAENVKLPQKSGTENRALGHFVIDVNGIKIDFLNTHLSNEDSVLRSEQFAFIAERVKTLNTFILTGDFNTTNSAKYSLIPNKIRVNNDKYATYPSSAKAIDEIMAYHYWSVVDSGMDKCNGHSDHNLLWAELCYDGGMK